MEQKIRWFPHLGRPAGFPFQWHQDHRIGYKPIVWPCWNFWEMLLGFPEILCSVPAMGRGSSPPQEQQDLKSLEPSHLLPQSEIKSCDSGTI